MLLGLYCGADCPVKLRNLLSSLVRITPGAKLTFMSSFKDQLLFIILLETEDGTMKSQTSSMLNIKR